MLEHLLLILSEEKRAPWTFSATSRPLSFNRD
jgi:hypothetical protein